MDHEILSDFIALTSSGPGLAQDLLEAHGWDLQQALSAFKILQCVSLEPVPAKQPDGEPLISLTQDIGTKHSDVAWGKACSMKPPLKKELAVDLDETKKLTRGISRATENINLVSKARSKFAQDFSSPGMGMVSCERESPLSSQLLLETPVFTFTLPNLAQQPEDFREFLERDLIETSTLVSLEQAGRLNWWAEMGACQRLWPLATTGDGNCLLHAASLGMWGFHDRLLTLRRALHSLLSKSAYTVAFYRRWRWQTSLQNQEAGLVYCEEEWAKEWQALLQLASTQPRTRASESSKKLCTKESLDLDPVLEEESPSYESLEEIHVMALSHVLRRPIVIIADTVLKDVQGEPFAPIPFGGIYLPLECGCPADCHRSPLCLTYDAAHFSALVAMERDYRAAITAETIAAIPLTDPNHHLLPIKFEIDPGPEVLWDTDKTKFALGEKERLSLLSEYMDIVDIPILVPNNSTPFISSAANSQGKVENPWKGTLDRLEDNIPLGAGFLPQQGRNKASKQLQSVVKQFGSLSRTMSKKLKINFGSLARGGKSKTNSHQMRDSEPKAVGMVAAVLHTDKRHEYQETMIKNYLSSAQVRFQKEKVALQKPGSFKNWAVATTPCVSIGCSMYGTADNHYLCSACFASQKARQSEIATHNSHQKIEEGKDSEEKGRGVVTRPGNSAFYLESSGAVVLDPLSPSKSALRNMAHPDQTLYLAKSVFYAGNDIFKEAVEGGTDLDRCGSPKPSNLVHAEPIH